MTAPSGPKLVTRTWLEEASRIKRRVTTNGGKDMALVDYIMASLQDRPDFVSKAEKMAEGDQRDWKSALREKLKSRCLFLRDKVNIH